MHALHRGVLLTLVAPVAIAHAQPVPPATLVVHHARILTMDAAHPEAQGVAMRGDTIVLVGTDAEVRTLIGPRTQVIDARGRTVLPGFTDTHVHFSMGALALARVAFDGHRDVAQIRSTLRRWKAQHPGRGWVQGWGWTYGMIGGDGMPHRRDLDDIFPDRPVLLSAYDGHTTWANSRALALAGITRETPDPPNGVIVRDATGEPTGALKERASQLVAKLIPPPTPMERRRAVLAGLRYASSLGLTRVHSAHGDSTILPLLDSLQRAGALPVRFDIGVFADPPALQPALVARLEELRTQYASSWVSANLVKLMIDGVVESHTAAMLDPYTTDSSSRGALFWPESAFVRAVRELDARGFRLMTHAIGDRGVRTVLDAYAAARAANGDRARVHRIEHIETIAAADIPRFGREAVIASMQPMHAYPENDGEGVWTAQIGADRSGRAWVWKRIGDGGGAVSFGSDWPVATLDPWPGVQVAVTRQTDDGRPPTGFVPTERLTVEEAVARYTLGGAVAGGRAAQEGSISVGKRADMIVVSRDPRTVPARELRTIRVHQTIAGGRVVYRRPGVP